MKKLIIYSSLVVLTSCSTAHRPMEKNNSVERKTAALPESVKVVKVLKDITINLDRPTRVSEYCFFHPMHDYIYINSQTEEYNRSTANASEFKDKSLILKAGTELKVYQSQNTTPGRVRFPYREFSGGHTTDPEVYQNYVTLLTAYDKIPGKYKEAYLSLDLVCRSDRFRTPVFGDKYKNRIETREKFINDVNKKMSTYLEFDGEVLLNQDEPDNDYY